ncbi:hypothetical protein PAP_02860 [Palaeococcus pacificus DY20341]|uniref:Uncharacterized protein n=1 Tax=Palaeococcus pacificus DY20341 TaxID=1343739 RepID=A0A075LWR9_9EURY|nr:hypothetical protein [Palaeococcus pacificus]AIF68993.1 hypothetical protein PAP_02860 [Palaeococcus pacificus DY20341]
MEKEEYLIILGVLLIVGFFLFPSENLSGMFCDGDRGTLGDYYISVQNGFLMVSSNSQELFVARGRNVILKKIELDYSFSNGCYTLNVRRKPEEALYLFILGVVLIGMAFYYLAFLKYR